MSPKPKRLPEVEILENQNGKWKPAQPAPEVGEVFEYYKREVWAKGLATGMPEVLAHLLGIKCEGYLLTDPDVRCLPEEVSSKLNRPTALWWNPKQLCLVITDGTTSVGVPVSQLRIPMLGMNWPRVEAIYQGLRANQVVH